ncbi:YggS family pyridoxal phosphate-dependent enzyme [Thiorhodovibrio frisius]|uniref:Pyridoxal phosphate homeostasis protein n=1 Tax=Thiorhodovibrio frisius TaxID=631362 RepID=H8Z7N3_9GAMM|nr:YggS family pyridoxal phosphate-dependent enzyme [Thiorhodovibrio frisius]EIC19886.1 pyridoxal phosphate enzyme, YggS family [Thiorhodovibrio frisius]WPL20614.1 pyridoxal phosphate enzyme, YggS family [Thiorhodovibrio frisius]
MNTDHDSQIATCIEQVRARIQAAEQRFGREPGSVRLLAVSKRQPLSKLMAAHAAGLRAFGESYVQEGVEKQQAAAGHDIEWHFIGRVQSNKTRQIAEHFDWVHGLTSADHARRLAAQRPSERGPVHVCVQVNLSGEASKAGIEPEQAADLIAEIEDFESLRLEGLMTLPAPAEDFAAQRRPFAALRALRDQLAREHRPLPTLSMGMSRDLEAAIAEGATMVRVGTALFGERAPV